MLGFEIATTAKGDRPLLAFESCLAVSNLPLRSERVSRLALSFQKMISVSNCKETLLISLLQTS